MRARALMRARTHAMTPVVRTSTPSARLMAAKIAEMLLIVGLPDAEGIRWRLFAGLWISSARDSKPTVAFTRSRKTSFAVSGSPFDEQGDRLVEQRLRKRGITLHPCSDGLLEVAGHCHGQAAFLVRALRRL